MFNAAQICADTIFEGRANYVKYVRERWFKMEIQNWSEDIILVDLHREPQMGDELKTVIDIVSDRGDCDVILDFSGVDIITSPSLGKLLRLRQLLTDCEHRLIFCSVNAFTIGAFKVTGLDGLFKVVEDKSAASTELGMAVGSKSD